MLTDCGTDETGYGSRAVIVALLREWLKCVRAYSNREHWTGMRVATERRQNQGHDGFVQRTHLFSYYFPVYLPCNRLIALSCTQMLLMSYASSGAPSF